MSENRYFPSLIKGGKNSLAMPIFICVYQKISQWLWNSHNGGNYFFALERLRKSLKQNFRTSHNFDISAIADTMFVSVSGEDGTPIVILT